MPVEVEQVYVRRGAMIGFEQTDGQLIAVADRTTKPLGVAHYEWKTYGGEGVEDSHRSKVLHEAMTDVLVVAGAVAVVGLVLWAVHDDRHSLAADVVSSH
jgi:hypothetical protein